MAKEIERKFLVCGQAWRALAVGVVYRQGYLNSARERTVRVRTAGDRAYLTVKGPTQGISRLEFEYEIDYAEAVQMLSELAEKPIIEKTRYRIARGAHVWEIDEFHGDNDGLIVAEVELSDPDEPIDCPEWIGQEVSDDPRYFNSSLASHPYRLWKNTP